MILHPDGAFSTDRIVDVFKINKRPVLCTIYRDTRYLSCTYMSGMTADAIWDSILGA